MEPEALAILINDLQTERDMLIGSSISAGLVAAAMGGAGGPSTVAPSRGGMSGGARKRASSPPPNTLAAPSMPDSASFVRTIADATTAQSRGGAPPLLQGTTVVASLNNIARTAGYPSHNALIAATTPSEPFRDPQFLMNNVDKFRYLLVATHGILIPDEYQTIMPLTYTVPANTILVKTGGLNACGKVVRATIFRDYLYQYFKPAVRKYIFCKFLGNRDDSENSIFPTMQFITPGDQTYNKDLSLSVADTTSTALRGLIGVSEMTYDTAGNMRLNQNQSMVNGIINWKATHGGAGLTEDQLVASANAAYPVGGSTGIIANVMILMSCSRGPSFAYAARTAIKEASRVTNYTPALPAVSFTGCPLVRPSVLPPFPAVCRKESYRSTPTSTNAKSNVDKIPINSEAGYFVNAQALRERLEEELSVVAVHKDMLITYINRTITLAQRSMTDPSINCDIGGSLKMIEDCRTEYENAQQNISNNAREIKQSSEFKLHHPGMVKPNQVGPLIAFIDSIDLAQYARNLETAKAAVTFGRARAAARTKRGWRWLCSLPVNAASGIISYFKGKGGGRKTRRMRSKRRKTRRA